MSRPGNWWGCSGNWRHPYHRIPEETKSLPSSPPGNWRGCWRGCFSPAMPKRSRPNSGPGGMAIPVRSPRFSMPTAITGSCPTMPPNIWGSPASGNSWLGFPLPWGPLCRLSLPEQWPATIHCVPEFPFPARPQSWNVGSGRSPWPGFWGRGRPLPDQRPIFFESLITWPGRIGLGVRPCAATWWRCSALPTTRNTENWWRS